jgi:hypothetical protein
MRFLAWLAFVVMLPVALGPARMTIERALGGEPSHACACGMKRGTCGCPECERLDREAKKVSKHVAVRSTCEDDDGFVRAPAAPIVTMPNAPLVVARATSVMWERPSVSSLDSQLAREPSTPPPRASSQHLAT